MASLKSLKNRIKTVRSTQKLTKAMKMVAASKLKRARERAAAARPYAVKMAQIVGALAGSHRAGGKSLLTGTGRDHTYLLVVNTADRGLCGAFNSAIVKLVRQEIESLLAQQKQVKIMCVGRKGYELLKRRYPNLIVAQREAPGNTTFADATHVAEEILSLFAHDQFDICRLYYSQFKSVISQIPAMQQIIPLQLEEGDPNEVYEVESTNEDLLERLLPQNIAVQLYSALLENTASEYSARMTAMENATRNSGDMIRKLNLLYNRTRQAYITKELIEIISGAEAV